MNLKLGSLFDGSGGFPLAGSLCGVNPVWASEVEPYPIAVTRSRFPGMKHLGDISKVNGGEIEPVDIITFGSPCQDLSVAGKRAGLKHEVNGDEETTRSGLFMEAERIIKEMREATNGLYPKFALWENVPGAFSSNKGEDFRIVLEELIKIVEPEAVMPAVPAKGWAYADSYIGDGWSLAYRVFDAQFWGVPQRRRRIHLVLDLRGECAEKVLFEREGLRGYFEAGRTPWKGSAGDVESCAGADDRAGECVAYSFGSLSSNSMRSKNPNSGCRLVEVAKTLDCFDPSPAKNQGGIAVLQPIEMVLDDQGGQQITVRTDGKSNTLRAEMYGNAPCVMCYDARGNGDGETVNTITGDHENRITDYTSVVVEHAYCLQGNTIDRNAKQNGSGICEDVAYTMNAVDRHGVCYCMAHGQSNAEICVDKSSCLNCNHEKPIVFDKEVYNSGINAAGGHYIADGGPAPTLRTSVPPGVCVRHTVRRLTPTECARLQGFPDTWGHPDIKEDFTDEEYSFWVEVRNTHAAINGKQVKEYTKKQMLTWYNKLHTDSAEYKMWGNGIALPPALYCMQGMVDALSEQWG